MLDQLNGESWILPSWRGWSSGRMGSSINRFSVVVEVLKDFFDDRRIFDTGNDLNDTATLTTGFNVDSIVDLLSRSSCKSTPNLRHGTVLRGQVRIRKTIHCLEIIAGDGGKNPNSRYRYRGSDPSPTTGHPPVTSAHPATSENTEVTARLIDNSKNTVYLVVRM